jgi:hypothetical protein
MQKLCFVFAVAMLFAGSSVAFGQRSAVMKPINQFVNGFNKGDTASAMAACSEATAIIDEFPPYMWTGQGACQKWVDDYDADAKENHITNGIVTLNRPAHFEINGDMAYVVIPSNYTYKQNGKKMGQYGSFFTFVLSKRSDEWMITAWSWGTK